MLDSTLSRRFPFLALAKQNLMRARARSVLAMAGITIGVIALASLGIFGAAYEQSYRNSFDTTASSVLVTPGEDAPSPHFDRENVKTIERNVDSPVYPIAQYGGSASGLGGETSTTVVSMQRPTAFVTVSEGQIPEEWRSGVVVGASVAETLDTRPGETIVLNGERRRVRAVLDEASRSNFLQPDEKVFISPSQSTRSQYQFIIVNADSPTAAFETAEALDENLNGRRTFYDIVDFESAIERFNQQMSTLQTFLFGIGGVSLLVASVSILNVMLMSTIERKEEIGVMRAVGYRRLDILRLMLSEAALLGLFGAIFGVVISIGLGLVINAEFLSDPFAFTVDAITFTALGFLFGTVASFISGLYPAWKAANARPVESLRD